MRGYNRAELGLAVWPVVFVAALAGGGCEGNLFREIEPLGGMAATDADTGPVDVNEQKPTDTDDSTVEPDLESRDVSEDSSPDADATDSDGDDATDGGESVCESPTCPGTDTECGCSDCVDCTEKDGWRIARRYDCCHQGESCTCVVRENREYVCGDDNSCEYTVTDTNMFRRDCRSDCR